MSTPPLTPTEQAAAGAILRHFGQKETCEDCLLLIRDITAALQPTMEAPHGAERRIAEIKARLKAGLHPWQLAVTGSGQTAEDLWRQDWVARACDDENIDGPEGALIANAPMDLRHILNENARLSAALDNANERWVGAEQDRERADRQIRVHLDIARAAERERDEARAELDRVIREAGTYKAKDEVAHRRPLGPGEEADDV